MRLTCNLYETTTKPGLMYSLVVGVYIIHVFVKFYLQRDVLKQKIDIDDSLLCTLRPRSHDNGMKLKFLRLGVAFTRCRYEIV